MEAVQSWCFTVCVGIVFCGIIMMLVPSERYRPIIQMILGLFILLCLLSWSQLSGIHIDLDTDAAEEKRQETAEETDEYFLNRVKEQSEETVNETVSNYLAQYGINRDEYQIYIGTEEPDENGECEWTVTLTLPQRLSAKHDEIAKALTYELGMTVRITYQ